ncbi:42431a40-f64b-4539-9fda-4671ff22f48e-CDS [Sclerotinia trifoliorum]|uniref:42431a40-f64b-4539-9fda-4671ff22f48e-CDS n=1 Tax=Sclerotinia trifoliorum TaxID=28548 RepID=A0A8H2ZR95_9HELO|nr:42431a40-f64b-4539-9fda-4671ff22f48e-CDS [Sclerotinia trifoliorum]
MGTFRQLAKDDPQRPQVLTDLRARFAALSISWKDAVCSRLTRDKHICTSSWGDLYLDIISTRRWSIEVSVVGQA